MGYLFIFVSNYGGTAGESPVPRGREFFYFNFSVKEVVIVLGMQDVWVSAAWLLSIGSALGCVVYGALHWNYEEKE
jgi:hypothetical protein